MERRYVFTLRNPLKDLSAEHDVLGIAAKMEIASLFAVVVASL
jgi:hypothetical protein